MHKVHISHVYIQISVIGTILGYACKQEWRFEPPNHLFLWQNLKPQNPVKGVRVILLGKTPLVVLASVISCFRLSAENFLIPKLLLHSLIFIIPLGIQKVCLYLSTLLLLLLLFFDLWLLGWSDNFCYKYCRWCGCPRLVGPIYKFWVLFVLWISY